jgi:NADH:ubiquinone oxidoreductase subunit K
MKINHNTLAVIFPILISILLALFVYSVPAVGLAPEETAMKVLLRLAIFFAAWPLAIKFLGGWEYHVTEESKAQSITGIDVIACAIIIGAAIVIAK